MLYSAGQGISSTSLPYGKVVGDWSDKEVFLIGAGPSLEGFNFDVLDGYTIGANKTALVANTDVMFSLDYRYMKEYHNEIMQYSGEVYFGVLNKHETYYNPNCTYLKAEREGGLSSDPHMVIGLNSGYGALNIAYLKNARKINLLGLDMRISAKKHFHGGYEWDKSKGASYNSWARRFQIAKKSLDARDIEVINWVGPKGSGLDNYFQSRPLKELDPDYPQ